LREEDPMTQEEYEERLRALEEQHRADVALLNAAHETRLRSLSRLREDAMEREGDSAVPETPSATAPAHVAAIEPSAAAATAPPKPALARYTVLYDLEEAFPDVPEVFNRHNIIRLLGYEPARATLARALESLKDEGRIAVEEQSLGGSVNRYRKLPSED
jgi:hypothetical protein